MEPTQDTKCGVCRGDGPLVTTREYEGKPTPVCEGCLGLLPDEPPTTPQSPRAIAAGAER